MTTFRKPIVWITLTITVVLLAFQAHRAAGLAKQVRALQRETKPWMQHAQKLEQERNEATIRLASLMDEKTALQSNSDEILRLRTEAPKLQEVSKKVDHFEAAGGSLPQLERMLVKANTPATNRPQSLIHQSFLNFVTRYKSVAGLTADQEQIVRDLMLKQADVQNEIMLRESQGTLPHERKVELDQTFSNLTAQMDAVIPADRRAALKEAVDAGMERNKEIWARLGADGELAMLQSRVGTSRDQEEQLFPILYDLGLKTRNGDKVSPSEKVDAVSKVLTPKQIETYRKLIEENTFQAIIQTGLR